MVEVRERERNLFAKLNNDKTANITKYTEAGCQRSIYAYQCWPPMTKS